MKAVLNTRTKTIDIVQDVGDSIFYQIDLEQCCNSSQLLDWLFQVNGKAWCTPELLKAIMDVIEDSSYKYFSKCAQGLYCSIGKDHKVVWKSVL